MPCRHCKFRSCPGAERHWYNRHMLRNLSQTICALSTPQGRSGIGVIRVTGTQCFPFVTLICKFSPEFLNDQPGHVLRRAIVYDRSMNPIDDVVIGIYKGPRSFTGEDTIEIMAHGGPVPLRRIIERLLEAGCRHALPGEFSQRAFMNGKIDLVQAEAIADIIASETDRSHQLAMSQESGGLSRAVSSAKETLMPVLAAVEASIDFPEDVGELDYPACVSQVEVCCEALDKLIRSGTRGILFREGVRVAIVGRPNAGKSSLLNALLRNDRAIVASVPGTTRDTIEEGYNLRGIPLRAVDTAGIRNTSDVVEALGVERSRSIIRSADVSIHVYDGTDPSTAEDDEIVALLQGKPHLSVWNKCDLQVPKEKSGWNIVISARDGTGISELEDALYALVTEGTDDIDDRDAVVTHARQLHALSSARTACEHALASARAHMPPDFVSIDLRGALNHIGEVTGETTTDDVIEEIFARFCIGK